MTTITYRRLGREKRSRGTVVRKNGEMALVKPDRKEWRSVWVTPQEIAAGVNGLTIARKKPSATKSHKEKPKPVKAAPVPQWKQLVARAQSFLEEYRHDLAISRETKELVAALAEELEKSNNLFAK